MMRPSPPRRSRGANDPGGTNDPGRSKNEQSSSSSSSQTPVQRQQQQQQTDQQRQSPYPRYGPIIAPAPDRASRSGVSTPASYAPSSSREIPARPKRKLVNLACTACQKRKSKCDGQQPCNLCQAKNTECLFVQNDKQTRIDRLEQEREYMANKVTRYQSVLEYLRNGADEEASEILRRIRSSESTDETVAMIESSMLLLSTPSAAQKSRRTSQDSTARSTRTSPPPASPGPASFASNTSQPSPTVDFFRTNSQTSASRVESTPTPVGKKRKYDDLEKENSRYRELLDALHTGTELDAVAILRRSRSDYDKDQTYRLPSGPVVSEPDGRIQHAETSVLQLPTEPKWQIKAMLWTTQTDDDAFASHLLRAYFKNEHSGMPCFDEDIFLEDAKSGRQENCSAMLMNAVLSAGAGFCKHCSFRQHPWRKECWSRVFFETAMRLRVAEEGVESLSMLQTTMVLIITAGRNGRHDIRGDFLARAVNMARSLNLDQDPTTWAGKPTDPEDAVKWTKARQATVWGLFHMQCVTQYTLQRACLMKKPPEIAVLYDGSATSDTELRAQFNLTIIANDIAILHFSDDDRNIMAACSIEATEEAYQRLLSWKEHVVKSGLDPTVFLSSSWTLLLHMYWHYLVISLFRPFMDESSLSAPRRFYHTRGASLSRESVDQLRILLRTFSVRRGFMGCASGIMHILAYAAYLALEELETSKHRPILSSIEEQTELQAKASLEECIFALDMVAHDSYTAQGLLKVVQIRVQRMGLKLRVASEAALAAVADKAWVEEAFRYMRCHSPAVLDGNDVMRVDDVIRQDHDHAFPPHGGVGVQ